MCASAYDSALLAQLDDVAALTARPLCAQWGHHVHCTV